MKLTRAILVAFVVADASLVFALARARSAYHFESGPFRSGVSAIALPSGFLVGGAPHNPPPSPRCALIQFTSTLCPDCDLNWIVASRLSRKLQSVGCHAIRLAPSPGQLPVRQAQGNEANVGWVGPDWLEKVPRLELEPTTIALGPGGKIVWYGVGELTPADVRNAVAKVQASLR